MPDTHLDRANKIAPDNTDIILLMAQITISQKYFEDAVPLLEKGLQIAPQRSDLRSALGESYFKSDKIDKAIDEFNQVIAVAPSAHAYAFLGLSYAYLGRFDEAKQNFQNGLKLEPRDSFCMFHLGYIAERQGDIANAEDMFLKALRADPDFPYALLELANLRAQSKRFAEAEELLKRYIRVSSNPASGYYRLAMVESLHNTAAADRDLATFQTLNRGEIAGAHLYEHLYDYLDNPASGKIIWGLGIVAVPEGNAAVATAQFERAVDMLPEWPRSYSTLGVFYFQTGQIAKSQEILDRFKNSNAGGLDVNRIEEVLARTPQASPADKEPMQMAARQQLLQMALSLADKTL